MAETPPPQNDAILRQDIARVLPAAIKKALTSYENFVIDNNYDDSKQFSAHHSACKAAITHLELLLKLAKWSDITATTNTEDAALMETLILAQSRIDENRAKMNTLNIDNEDE